MYNAYNSRLLQDSNNPVGPSPNASPYSFIFFLLYMCTMTLVLLNMFIGFVIVTFQEVGIKAFRESKLDRNQVRVTSGSSVGSFIQSCVLFQQT